MKPALRALLLLIAFPLSAVDLADLFRGALDRDLELKRISLSRKNLGIAQAKAKASRGMQFSLDSSGVTLTQELGSDASLDDTYIATTNGVTLSLGEPFYTRFGIGIPVSYSTGLTSDTTAPGFRTGAGGSVTQPINPLLGWTPHAAEDMALQNTQEKIGMDRSAREVALHKEIVGSIRILVGLEQKLFDADASARDARAELERTRALQTYDEGSYAIRKLEGTLVRLEKEKAQTAAEMSLRRENLERKTGVSLGESPVSSAVSFGDPQPVGSFDAKPEANAAVHLAGLAVDVAVEKVKEEGFKDLPSLSLRGGYNFNTTWLNNTLTWYHYPTLSVSVSWKMFDGGLSRLNVTSLENELAMARLALQGAEADYQATWAETVLAGRDIERRKELLAEQQALQELEVKEKLEALEKGIATEQEVEQSRTRLQRLAYDGLLFRCDEWLLSIQAEALNLAGR